MISTVLELSLQLPMLLALAEIKWYSYWSVWLAGHCLILSYYPTVPLLKAMPRLKWTLEWQCWPSWTWNSSWFILSPSATDFNVMQTEGSTHLYNHSFLFWPLKIFAGIISSRPASYYEFQCWFVEVTWFSFPIFLPKEENWYLLTSSLIWLREVALTCVWCWHPLPVVCYLMSLQFFLQPTVKQQVCAIVTLNLYWQRYQTYPSWPNPIPH